MSTLAFATPQVALSFRTDKSDAAQRINSRFACDIWGAIRGPLKSRPFWVSNSIEPEFSSSLLRLKNRAFWKSPNKKTPKPNSRSDLEVNEVKVTVFWIKKFIRDARKSCLSLPNIATRNAQVTLSHESRFDHANNWLPLPPSPLYFLCDGVPQYIQLLGDLRSHVAVTCHKWVVLFTTFVCKTL